MHLIFGTKTSKARSTATSARELRLFSRSLLFSDMEAQIAMKL